MIYADSVCITDYLQNYARKPFEKQKMFLSNPSAPKDKKLLDQFRDALRVKHYFPRTEYPYLQWVKNDIHFHNKRDD